MAVFDRALLPELTQCIYGIEVPTVVSAYSDYDSDLEYFTSVEQVNEYLARSDLVFAYLALWYPSCGGRIDRKRIQLRPEKCDGHTFRYTVLGWGIFQFQCDFKRSPLVDCRIAVNSHARALKWESTYPDLLAVEEWNWPAIEKHERRLTRKVRSLASRC